MGQKCLHPPQEVVLNAYSSMFPQKRLVFHAFTSRRPVLRPYPAPSSATARAWRRAAAHSASAARSPRA